MSLRKQVPLANDGGTNLFVAQLLPDAGVRTVRSWPQAGVQTALDAVWVGNQLILLATCDSASSAANPCAGTGNGVVLFAIQP